MSQGTARCGLPALLAVNRKLFLLLLASLALCPAPAIGQHGSISGRVTLGDGRGLPGIMVEVAGDLLPQPRRTTTAANGDCRLPLLPPEDYELKFTRAGMTTLRRQVGVLLQQNTTVNATMRAAAVEEQIEVVGETSFIDLASAELKASLADEVITQVPLGQEYRDLVKLIPGVQYTEDSVRGPSAGGSGQDNVYQFDGVNVGLPLFGTLSAEPSSYDVDQISIVRGGAKALDFNRSGGFTINSVSKSDTNALHGAVSYQVQTESMTGTRVDGSSEEFEENQTWAVFSLGGPLLRERLFFYTSYYQPTVTETNRANVFGNPDDEKEERNELFASIGRARGSCPATLKLGAPFKIGSTIRLQAARGFPADVLRDAIGLWEACPDYGTGFPRFVTEGEGDIVVAVRLEKHMNGAARCAQIRNGEIEVFRRVRDHESFLHDCGPLAEILAHELGHLVDLADGGRERVCQSSVMGSLYAWKLDEKKREPRSVPLNACQAVSRRWLTWEELAARAAFLSDQPDRLRLQLSAETPIEAREGVLSRLARADRPAD